MLAFLHQAETRSKSGLPTPPEKTAWQQQQIAAQQQALQLQIQQVQQMQQHAQQLEMQRLVEAQKAYGDAYHRADFEAFHAGVSIYV